MSKRTAKAFLFTLKNEKLESFYHALTTGYLEFFYNDSFKKQHFKELNNLLRYKYSLNLREHLTIQEMRCLYLAAYGKSTQEIAFLLKLSSKTVEEYRSSLFKKLNATNMPQAIMKGFYLNHSNFINL